MTDAWTMPTPAKPVDLYRALTEPIDNGPGVTDSTSVAVERIADDTLVLNQVVASYDRDLYGNPFYPFRQLRDGVWRDYSLISHEYVRTSVLDLESGLVIADEPYPLDAAGTERPGWGFCPLEFYVPDYYDVHDGSIGPTSEYWDPARHQGPTGEYGFVAGCVWGDDSSLKLRFVDLSRISEGTVSVDDRFGYLELAAPLPQAIRVHSQGFEVATSISFDFGGAPSPEMLAGLTEPSWRSARRPGE